MDTFLTIASKRDTRGYRDDPLPTEAVQRILDAGRIAGSGKNRQARRFIVLSADVQQEASHHVTRPSNVRGAALVIAVVIEEGTYSVFDAARAAQNMMLAAWSELIASCPNAVKDAGSLKALFQLSDGESVAILVSFGYPARQVHPEERSAPAWIEAADRVPLADAVEYR